jgi:hypothetical protein
MTFYARARRRKTTLPDLTAPVHTTGGFSKAMKQAFIGPILDQIHQTTASILAAGFEPDPWDEAVRWIERKHEAELEWPWPARS